ncbi:hypothetical protein FJZ17_04355 [Candidatus Pacearchaeota archaeon]|nr:hypothetical protein [Candidatus Pacearchaeota archaeon]
MANITLRRAILILIIIVILGWVFMGVLEKSIWKDSSSENFKISSSIKEINLTFYDNQSSCIINGEIYVDNISLGNTTGGIFVLKEEDYNKKFKFNSTLFLLGKTDYCFGVNSNLPFVEYWNIYDLQSYFNTGQELKFETTLNPRQPVYYSAMMDFVRPEEVKVELAEMKIDINDSLFEKMDLIFKKFYMQYQEDSSKFGVYEYWQTPKESRINNGGDCEDWAVRFVSLLRAYNSSLNCYVAVWDTHANVICRIERKFIIYDQEKVTKNAFIDKNPTKGEVILQDNKIKMRDWLKSYFLEYGLSSKERRLYALFNEKELLTFNNTEDFISWAVENYT